MRSLAVMLGTGGAMAGAGCAPGDDEPRLGVIRSAATVDSFVTSSCSTAVVLALSQQVAEEIDCMMPGQLVRFEAVGGVRITGAAVLPFLDEAARADLYAATATGRVLEINSAFRSVVQQFLLRAWFERGRCGITAAALPGTSNHESGRAIDVSNWFDWVADLAAYGWDQTVPGDEVHFDHLASPDIRGADVLAFQRLWNRNHPEDAIAEDGGYGPETEVRVRQAPAEGFPLGATCAVGGDRVLDVIEVVGPDAIRPGERGLFVVRLRNAGAAAWPATTALVTATGAPSVLADPATWDSATQVLALGEEVVPGGEIERAFEVLGPAVDVATPVAERFALADGGARFGAVPIAVVVDPDAGADAAGGCAARGGGSPGLVVVALLGLATRRRARGTRTP